MTAHTRPGPIETATRAIDALLMAIDGASTIGAVTAYRAAITRHGQQLVEVAGFGALEVVRYRLRDEAPDIETAQDRERIVSLAWEGLAA